ANWRQHPCMISAHSVTTLRASDLTGKRMFSHGTLLLDSDLGEVANALNVKMSKIASKGHKSVRSRVANISEFLEETVDIFTFRRSEEHTSELQSRENLVCRLLLEK